MSKRTCRECQTPASLSIIGLGELGDTIEVECSACGEIYEVEPDGLGEAGMEMLEAYEVEERKAADIKHRNEELRKQREIENAQE